jgi:response regulator RpfG family c-di-GMP phosphodiesterase
MRVALGSLTGAVDAPHVLDTRDERCVSRHVMPDEGPSTILVVDDEHAVVQSIAALLELETPHRVVVETSPLRAVQLAKVDPPDLVISDFLMPELDGIKFLLEVRGLYPESTLILLTGYADKENAIRAINEVGIFHYMEKPWDNDDLLTIIRTGLDKRLQLHRLHERARELEARVRQLQQRNTELEERLKTALGSGS